MTRVYRTMLAAFALAFSLMSAGTAFANHLTLKVVNRSSWTIAFVYIVPEGQATWGNDQLPDEVVMGPDTQYSWTIPWDVCFVQAKASTLLGIPSTQDNSIYICGGGEVTEWTIYDE